MSSLFIPSSSFKDIPFLSRLLELHDIPKGVYIQGTLPQVCFDEYGMSHPRILTIVGSRKCTSYGKRALEHILSSLDKEEVIIVSGLALGIDTKAHTESLQKNIQTIAIPGSGLGAKALYPPTNRTLAEDILTKGGVLISLLQDEEKPAQWTFPARNRVMAALSDAVLIVEAEEKSGTLITARMALELGKDIGAVPGDIFSPFSLGTLSLIKDGATPITNAADLRDFLHLKEKEPLAEVKLLLTKEEELLLALLSESKDKDTLLMESKLSFSSFITTVTTLEVKGYIEETFGELRKIV